MDVATLALSQDGGKTWSTQRGPRHEVVSALNRMIAELGAPSSVTTSVNDKADVVTIKWAATVARLTAHKVPDYVPVYCPTCRAQLAPPEWGGRTSCHNWRPTWALINGALTCVELRKEG